MAMKLSQRLVQRQIMAPVLQQSIEILVLALPELQQAIDQELQSNPLLEVDPQQKTKEKSPAEEIQARLENKPIGQDQHYNAPHFREEAPDERPIPALPCLEDALLRHLRVELTNPNEILIGELIIGNLSEDGYLTVCVDEICQTAQIDSPETVERVLFLIQNMEPVGIAARNLKECLILQSASKYPEHLALLEGIISDHLENLSRKKYRQIARDLKASEDDVKKAAELISNLDPRPARNFRPLQANLYVRPDIRIEKNEDDKFSIHLNNEWTPKLRISQTYLKILRDSKLKDEERQFIREKMKNAINFMRSVEQRGHTLKEITRVILEKQKEFFSNGSNTLVPLSLRDVAQEVDRNESTVSRAINNKYVETPKGLFPLKYFFAQGVEVEQEGGSTAVSSRTIKEEIDDLVVAEDPASPLSDQQIQDHFAQKGVKIARRTVAKYRQALEIQPSHLRKK